MGILKNKSMSPIYISSNIYNSNTANNLHTRAQTGVKAFVRTNYMYNFAPALFISKLIKASNQAFTNTTIYIIVFYYKLQYMLWHANKKHL